MCKGGENLETSVNYVGFPSKIKDLTIKIDNNRSIKFAPKTKEVIVDGVVKVEHYVKTSVIDDSFGYEVVKDCDKEKLSEIIRILQTLTVQVNQDNVKEENKLKENKCK